MSGAGSLEPTVVVGFPAPLVPVHHVRSTLLLASIRALREGGHFERYRDLLEPEFHDPLFNSIVGVSVPLEVAVAHYRACDALMLSSEEQLALGRVTGSGIREHITRVAGLIARGVGVTPWPILEQFPRFWSRAIEGGGVAVHRVGPKEARVFYSAGRLLESRYFRGALRGVAIGLVEAVTHRSYMTEIRGSAGSDRAIYKLQWV